MTQFILSIDQGTTSSRAILYTRNLEVVTSVQQEFEQHFPQNGWVEHDPEAIWSSVEHCVHQVIAQAKIAATDIAAIGITNQRETTVVWDRQTGKAVYPAIVWQDRRTASFCQGLSEKGLLREFKEKTGLLLDPYFSGTKIAWILEHVEGARDRAERGELCFGTIDSYLLWRLTNGQVHATDATNASRTLLFNIHTQQWDAQLLAHLNIPGSMLPEVCDTANHFGDTAEEVFGAAIPVCSLVGDQQAALVGQACFQPGELKSTYGTGCFAIVNTGDQAIFSTHRLLTTVGYRLQNQVTYALEGSIFMAGAIMQWLRDGLGIIESAEQSEALAHSISYEQSEIMVPAFTGLGAPYWDPNARAALFGMTRDTGPAQIVAAAIRSVAYQTRDLLEAMVADGIDITTLRVDGGMVNNQFFIKALADLTGVNVEKSSTIETTAKGAAMLAALQLGWYASLEELKQTWVLADTQQPELDQGSRELYYGQWQASVSKVRTQ